MGFLQIATAAAPHGVHDTNSHSSQTDILECPHNLPHLLHLDHHDPAVCDLLPEPLRPQREQRRQHNRACSGDGEWVWMWVWVWGVINDTQQLLSGARASKRAAAT